MEVIHRKTSNWKRDKQALDLSGMEAEHAIAAQGGFRLQNVGFTKEFQHFETVRISASLTKFIIIFFSLSTVDVRHVQTCGEFL